MLTIRTCKAFSKALGEYLRQADYYSEGMKVKGRCYGRLCAAVGLTAGTAITDEAFARVASNHHALTSEKLTGRMAAGRRAGYDATFNAPKSVSIQAFVGGDERLVTAHETAVKEALGELEAFACHQEGRGINKRYIPSGGIAAAVFRHGESRALDPHLHSHAFVFNVTRSSSQSDRLFALESSNIFERTKYLTEVYRNALAREVRQLGYRIERCSNGFELAGMSLDLLERFSKRAWERDRAIATREAELGRVLTHDEIAVLVRENRREKQYRLSPAQVRKVQLAQVSQQELAQLHALRTGTPAVAETVGLATVIARATEHLFERQTVVSEHEFTAEVMRQSYGQHSLAKLKTAVAQDNGLLHADGRVSTKAALELERALVRQINAGVGATDCELGYLQVDASRQLSAEQSEAVRTVLGSFDRVTVLRGRAGTGKTHALGAIIEGMARVDRQIACFAPSTQAVDVLKRDGSTHLSLGRAAAGRALLRAATIQRLLIDSAMQQSLRGKVVVVDEYGLLSTRVLKEVLDVAKAQKARVVLVGDAAQHKSVEAGDAARIVETESRVRIAELKDVRRQAVNPAYRAAAEDLAANRIAAGLGKLDRMQAIVEIPNPTDRRVRMVEEWFRASGETKSVRTPGGVQERAKSALMVAPTWVEIDALNTHAREKLRASGRISGEDQNFTSLRARDWTKARQKDIRNYHTGDVLVAHQATKHFQKGDELRVLRKEKGRLVVASKDREFSVSPRQTGLAWTVCDERPIPVASGDRVRLRAVAQVERLDGKTERRANGAVVTVKSLNRTGHLVLSDGSTLHSRQVVHGYAMTSHAAQGMTVDKVFVAGAISREGLYVSATRGRESIRIFVPDREEFLDTAGLRSEARLSAIEFTRRQALDQADLRDYLARAWQHLGQVRACLVARLAKRRVSDPVEDHAPSVHPSPSVQAQVRMGI